ncbi:MAG: glycoside hydrolase family 18 protein [Bacteroidales bacterium]|jgi:chitinase|nr:glycoside hydrolase family 18 protein [Bacteroidales bacterium]
MRKNLAIILTCLSFIALSCGSTNNSPDLMVVGYVAGFRNFDFSQINASSLTHINYAFANIINGEVMFGSEGIDNTDMNADDIRALNALKKVNPDLRILISVGGWGWSGNFSDAALTDSSRNRFAASAARFIKEYSLDGIDIDWEYPNHPGAGNTYRTEDVHNFTLMLECVRKHIDSLAAAEGRKDKYLLTIATGASEVYAANTELGPLSQYLDFINIMTYDFHHGASYQTGHHANLHISSFDAPDGDATDKAVELHLKAGVPPAKLNFGIPFYGRIWKGVEPINNGLYREAATTGAGMPYAEVLEALDNPAFTRFYDSSAASPFLWNESDSVFVSYEDVTSIAARMKYVREKGLGGVMFWEYTEDVGGKLLQAITDGLNATQ